MKWPKKHTKNMIYKSFIGTGAKTEEQILDATVKLAVKKHLYEFENEEIQDPKFSDLDSKDQAIISETLTEVINELTERELLKVKPDNTLSLTFDGINYVVNKVPKNLL
jgi:hypothetical protein